VPAELEPMVAVVLMEPEPEQQAVEMQAVTVLEPDLEPVLGLEPDLEPGPELEPDLDLEQVLAAVTVMALAARGATAAVPAMGSSPSPRIRIRPRLSCTRNYKPRSKPRSEPRSEPAPRLSNRPNLRSSSRNKPGPRLSNRPNLRSRPKNPIRTAAADQLSNTY